MAAEEKLAASQNAELQERWRDISAMQALAARADRATRIELDLLLAQLRDGYAAARQERPTSTTSAT